MLAKLLTFFSSSDKSKLKLALEHLCLEGALGPPFFDLSISYNFVNEQMAKTLSPHQIRVCGLLWLQRKQQALYIHLGVLGKHPLT